MSSINPFDYWARADEQLQKRIAEWRQVLPAAYVRAAEFFETHELYKPAPAALRLDGTETHDHTTPLEELQSACIGLAVLSAAHAVGLPLAPSIGRCSWRMETDAVTLTFIKDVEAATGLTTSVAEWNNAPERTTAEVRALLLRLAEAPR